MLEPYEGKLSRTVLRRVGASNRSFLFGGRLGDLSFTLLPANNMTSLAFPPLRYHGIDQRSHSPLHLFLARSCSRVSATLLLCSSSPPSLKSIYQLSCHSLYRCSILNCMYLFPIHSSLIFFRLFCYFRLWSHYFSYLLHQRYSVDLPH